MEAETLVTSLAPNFVTSTPNLVTACNHVILASKPCPKFVTKNYESYTGNGQILLRLQWECPNTTKVTPGMLGGYTGNLWDYLDGGLI
jgi:hypothetical protein